MNPLDSLTDAIAFCVFIATTEANKSPRSERGAALYKVASELAHIRFSVSGIDHTTTPSDPFLDAIRAGAEPETHGRTPTMEEIEDARNHRQPTPADLAEIDGD